MTEQPAPSAPDGFVAVAWATRPNGGNFFQHTQRHLRRAEDQVLDARTACGVKIPDRVTFPPRRSDMFARVKPLTGPDLRAAKPCPRCHKKATLAAQA